MNDNNFRFIPPDFDSPNNNANPSDIGFGRVDEIDGGISSNSNYSIDGNSYFCQSCNTNFISTNMVDSCIFCNSNNLIKTDSFNYQDTYKVPFLKSISDATISYKNAVKFNLFLPLSLRGSGFSIKKAYIPSKLYSVNIKGGVKFICANEIDKSTNVPVQSYEVSYDTNFDYNNILVSSYSNISSNVIDYINDYNFDNLSLVDSCDNDTYYINSGNVNLGDVQKLAVKSSLGIIKNNINYNYKKVKSNELLVNEIDSKNVLLPVYFLNIKYGDKNYFYLMNGQTGKIYTDFGISSKSVLIVSLIIFIVVFIITFLIAYIF